MSCYLQCLTAITSRNLIYSFSYHYYYDNEAYHIGEPVVTKTQAVAQMDDVFLLVKKSLGTKTITFRSDLEGALGYKASDFKNLERSWYQAPTIHRIYSSTNGATGAVGKSIIIRQVVLQAVQAYLKIHGHGLSKLRSISSTEYLIQN